MVPIISALLLLVAVSSATAEEYDVTVTLKGAAPMAVPFLRCARNAEVAGTEDVPEGCKEREPERFFAAQAARVTNLGSSIVWIHIGKAKIPILPGRVYRRVVQDGSGFNRIFLSGEPGGVAHIFASNPIQDEPEVDPSKSRDR